MTNPAEQLHLRIHGIIYEARGIHSFDLRPRDGKELPPFTAGSHIDVFLPNNVSRSYSLINSQNERHRYVITVNKDGASRGGSKFMHENLRVGDMLAVSAPINNFDLVENAAHTMFIGGGIGVTPLYCMIHRLEELGRPWTLHYAVRTKDQAAFLDAFRALEAKKSGRVLFNFDHEPGGKLLDLNAVVASAPKDSHLYCCGPLPMLGAFEEATKSFPRDKIHVEYFTPKAEMSTEGGFTVVLQRSGKSVVVPAGKSILDALMDVGVQVPYSCTEGVCGTCETRVIEGIPDHRNSILTEAEQKANKTMMICCSGSKSPKLVLDL